MKQNTKFLWIYIAILFSFALILILFAGLTQNNYQKKIEEQQTESAGVKRSLITLTDENQKMSDSIKSLESELDKAKEENSKLSEENEIMKNAISEDAETTQKLLDAYRFYSAGDGENAKKTLSGIESEKLTQTQKNIYNKIIGE